MKWNIAISKDIIILYYIFFSFYCQAQESWLALIQYQFKINQFSLHKSGYWHKCTNPSCIGNVGQPQKWRQPQKERQPQKGRQHQKGWQTQEWGQLLKLRRPQE